MIIYFILVGLGLFISGKLILGELRKEKKLLALDGEKVVADGVVVGNSANVKVEKFAESVIDQVGVLDKSGAFVDDQVPNTVEKLEVLLHEKNKEIDRLNTLLTIENQNKNEYEKIKNLLQWQIFESRQMNREVGRELKKLQEQEELRIKEAEKMRADLAYKDQVILKKDYQLANLNSVIQTRSIANSEHLSNDSSQDNQVDSSDYNFRIKN